MNMVKLLSKKIKKMIQGSNEWYKERLGKITASNAHKIMSPKGLGKTGETYVYSLVAGEMGAMQEKISSAAMWWGIEHEDDARAYYKIAFGVEELEQVGFIHHPTNFECGFSADGMVENILGAEIKCPYNPENHVKHLAVKNGSDLLTINKDYYWQCMFSMWCSDLEKWHFISYDPRFTGTYRMNAAVIERNKEHLDLIGERVDIALKLKHKIIKEIK